MFDLSDDTLTKAKRGSAIDRHVEDIKPDAPEQGDHEHELDTEQVQESHRILMSYYRQELDHQAENRAAMARDEDYYDNIQFTEEQVRELEERGQAPVVYNVIAQSINWILGSEKRGRTDFKILPRRKDEAKPAESKTKYMKYLADVNRTQFQRSRAFEDAVKVGIGWMESGVQEEDDGEPIYFRYESWRNMLWDSASMEIDGSDARYQFRTRWVDEDVALALFPDRADAVRRGVTDVSIYGSSALLDGDDAMDGSESEREQNGTLGAVSAHKRRRVRLIEAWYRRPAKVSKLKGGAFNGQEFDENDSRHAEEVEAGASVLVERVMMQTRVAIMTINDMLFDAKSPYRHNRFKFIPVWGNRRGRDGLPYGVTRGLIDIQDSINKRASKAIYILSTNKVIMDEGALPDGMSMDEFADEVSRPDAIIVKKAGKQIELNVDRDLGAAHLEMMSRDMQFAQTQSGVTDELLGRSTNAVSGIAVEKRQEQGSLATSKLFDNLRLSVQLHGEIELSLIEQYVTEEKEFRITNTRGSPEFVMLNDGLPENDIARTKADFVISEADWRSTMRQHALDQFNEMLTRMPPQVAMVLLDLIAESMDVPNREEIVKRIRTVNGQRDPDATEVTPEEQQAMAAQAEAAAAQKAMFELEMREKAAKAGKAEAETDKTKAQTVAENMQAALHGMEAATAVVTMPTIARVADNLLQEGGWQGGAPVQGMPPAQQGIPEPIAPPQQMEQPMPQGMPMDAPNGMVQ